MTKLVNVTDLEEKLITRTFPDLRHTLQSYANDHLEYKVAISVFNRWLGKDNLHLIDCRSNKEREERNSRMLCFWKSIYNSTNVYSYESISQKPDSQKINFVRYVNKEAYLKDCAYNPEKTSDQFQFVILPEFEALYYENWDDTNVLWYTSKEKIEPLLEQVGICGLYLIDFAF